MYNRYIPQPDGSYRRSRVQETNRREFRRPPSPKPEQCPPPPQEDHTPQKKDHRAVHKEPISRQENSIGSFLRNILPKNMDTGDLLVILLLLLMAGDSAEDQNTAMLTLAMYLFM